MRQSKWQNVISLGCMSRGLIYLYLKNTGWVKGLLFLNRRIHDVSHPANGCSSTLTWCFCWFVIDWQTFAYRYSWLFYKRYWSTDQMTWPILCPTYKWHMWRHRWTTGLKSWCIRDWKWGVLRNRVGEKWKKAGREKW